MRHLKQLLRQGGMSLIELSATLAIGAVIMVPLTSIISIQLRAPVKVASEITAKRQLQKASLMMTEDASAAKTFEFGTGQEYGTFYWEELSGGGPVPVTVRYFFEASIDEDSKLETGTLLRDVTRGGQELPPKIWLEGISKYEDVVFDYTPAVWSFDDLSRDWTFADGKVEVTVTQTMDAGAEFGATVTTETIVAHLRPGMTRPVNQPSPR